MEVCANQTGWTQCHHKMPVLLAGKVKEDVDRLLEISGKKGSRPTVSMQKDCNKIMCDLVKHQLTDKRSKPAS